MVELGEVYNIKYGLAESIPDNIDENGIKIISTAETNIDGNLDLSKIRKIKYFKKYDKFILNPDTLLFNWRNAPKHVGKTVYFNESSDKYIYASFLLALTKKNDQINNLFFWVILNKLREDGYFKRMSRQAVNQTNFNGGELAKVVIPLPSLKVQNKIVEAFLIEQKLVDANKKLITMFEQKITEKIASVWGK
ncbi:MAG: restriction endonuclease subunit S [Ignavibacteriaceae bacterium]|nr:restriction endonuclease subunit S [Ignavibacteriaceae bacterium]